MATLAATPWRPGTLPIAPLEDGEVVGFEAGKRRIEHFPAGDDDHIDRGSHLVPPEDLTGQALGTIAFDRRSEFSRRGHT